MTLGSLVQLKTTAELTPESLWAPDPAPHRLHCVKLNPQVCKMKDPTDSFHLLGQHQALAFIDLDSNTQELLPHEWTIIE